MANALDALILRVGNQDEHSALPVDVYTGTGTDPRPRLRVDPSQTSFWEGREFRLYHEFNIGAGTSIWLKYVFPVDVVVHDRVLSVMEGSCRFALSTGGTEAGVWTHKTVRPVNSMTESPAYTKQSTVFDGGTVTGSTERDVMLVETGTSANAVMARAEVSEVGLAAGTYYVELKNTGAGALRGLYAAHWEERAPRTDRLF